MADIGLERLVRPLLELVRHITKVETTFITEIHWDRGCQEVVLSLNTGALVVGEGAVVDWADSMCKLTFDRGWEVCTDVPGQFPGSIGATVVGMRTFFAVPVREGGRMIGTVCGASSAEVPVDEEQLALLRLVADAIACQLAAHARAASAEADALTDPLTALANRRGFERRLEAELARAERRGETLGLAVLDIDHFKHLNDTCGHDGGDLVLRALADTLRACARTEDVPARVGGDEFVLLVTAGGASAAAAVGERVRDGFAAATAAAGLACTVSIGVSGTDLVPAPELFSSADRALYAAKAAGRARVSAWAPELACSASEPGSVERVG